MSRIIIVKTCNECQYCEHNGRLQAASKIKLVCHHRNHPENNIIGPMYGPNGTHYDEGKQYAPPTWCPLDKGGKEC